MEGAIVDEYETYTSSRFSRRKEVFDFLKKFDEPLFVKIGMELYMQEGPDIVRKVKDLGHDIFLDLKLHDIPNTVGSAMKGLAKLGVDLVNVHAAGGRPMMEAALEGLEAGTPLGKVRPALIAVTQLTSTTEEQMQAEQKLLFHCKSLSYTTQGSQRKLAYKVLFALSMRLRRLLRRVEMNFYVSHLEFV